MAKNGKRSWVKWLVVLILLLGGSGGWVWYEGNRSEEGPRFISTIVSRGDVVQAVTATGQLNPVVNVQVGSQISGIIQKLYVDFNSKVKEGDILAQLDPSTYKANVAQSEGNLANAKANLSLSRVNAKRAQELFKNNLISESESDKAKADLEQAEAQVKIREADLQKVAVDLQRCTISSPIDGVVTDRKVDVGQTVAASMNAPTLFMIAKDLSKMQINANVSEADIGGIEEGQDVTFTVDAFAGRTFMGKVSQVRLAPQMIQNVVTYDTVIDVDNPDMKLKPGMTANVSVVTARKNSVVRVPNSALRFRPPEPSTNLNFSAKVLVKLGFKKAPETAASAAKQMAKAGATKAGSTNATAAGTITWTGNETSEELMTKIRDARQKGEEVPDSAQKKMRDLFASGQGRGGGSGGGGGFGGGGFGGGGGGSKGGGKSGGGDRTRGFSSRPMARTIYTLAATNAPTPSEPAVAKPQPVQIRTGISDGVFTEVLEGLKDGDTIITGVSLPQTAAATGPQQQAVNPFGGPRFGR